MKSTKETKKLLLRFILSEIHAQNGNLRLQEVLKIARERKDVGPLLAAYIDVTLIDICEVSPPTLTQLLEN